ncbi:MAG: hypothetical protein R3D29_11265 [Nitratireductor sp.]
MILDTRNDGIFVIGTSDVDGLTTPVGGGTVNAGDGADNVMGHDGDDIFIDQDLTSGDHYDGRGGTDTINYNGVTFTGTTTINLAAGTVINSFSTLFDYLANIENVIGSQGNDTIVTVAHSTRIDGQGGNDRIVIQDYDVGFFRHAVFDGGTGIDTLDLSGTNLTEALSVYLADEIGTPELASTQFSDSKTSMAPKMLIISSAMPVPISSTAAEVVTGSMAAPTPTQSMAAPVSIICMAKPVPISSTAAEVVTGSMAAPTPTQSMAAPVSIICMAKPVPTS